MTERPSLSRRRFNASLTWGLAGLAIIINAAVSQARAEQNWIKLAARGKRGGGRHTDSSNGGGDHGDVHDSHDSHDGSSDGSHDDSHDDSSDDGHDSGKRGPMYRGGRDPGRLSKGRGGHHTVETEVFRHDTGHEH